MPLFNSYCLGSFLTPGRSWARKRFRAETDVKEEEKVADGLHQPPDLRAGEEVLVPEVSVSGRSRPDRAAAGPVERAGHHLVPEPPGQAQARPGGDEGWRGVAEENHAAGPAQPRQYGGRGWVAARRRPRRKVAQYLPDLSRRTPGLPTVPILIQRPNHRWILGRWRGDRGGRLTVRRESGKRAFFFLLPQILHGYWQKRGI